MQDVYRQTDDVSDPTLAAHPNDYRGRTMKYFYCGLLLLAHAASALASEAVTENDKGFLYSQTSLYTMQFS